MFKKKKNKKDDILEKINRFEELNEKYRKSGINQEELREIRNISNAMFKRVYNEQKKRALLPVVLFYFSVFWLCLVAYLASIGKYPMLLAMALMVIFFYNTMKQIEFIRSNASLEVEGKIIDMVWEIDSNEEITK